MDKTIISLCGGSGSGKSLLAKQIAARIGLDQAVRIPTDFYLKSCACPCLGEFLQQPLHYDWDLLERVLREPSGTLFSTPAYDFVNFQRISEYGGRSSFLRPTVITDGMLPYPGADLTVLVTCPEVERKRRIIHRDHEWQTNVIAYWDLHQLTLEALLRDHQRFDLQLDGLESPVENVDKIYALWVSFKGSMQQAT